MRVPKTIDGWFASSTMRREAFWGTRTDRDGVLVFGTGRGDRTDPDGALLHEVAHFLEIDEARCFVYGFGLTMSKVIVNGEEYEDCLSFSPCAREIRVTAIQRVLHRHFRTPFNDHYWAKLIEDHVPGSMFACVHYKDDSLSYATKVNEGIAFMTMAQRRVRRMKRDIVERSKSLILSDLWRVWEHRSALHAERLRSGPAHADNRTI
jgi:hypothetical protein